MEEKHISEVGKVIVEASNGNWIPAAVVGSLFTVIILLLLYIYNRDRKSSDKRHNDSEEQLKVLTDIATELKADKVSKDRELRELKADVKTNRDDIKEILR